MICFYDTLKESSDELCRVSLINLWKSMEISIVEMHASRLSAWLVLELVVRLQPLMLHCLFRLHLLLLELHELIEIRELLRWRGVEVDEHHFCKDFLINFYRRYENY